MCVHANKCRNSFPTVPSPSRSPHPSSLLSTHHCASPAVEEDHGVELLRLLHNVLEGHSKFFLVLPKGKGLSSGIVLHCDAINNEQ